MSIKQFELIEFPYIEISESKINLLYIYDKSDLSNISDKELDRLVIDNIT